MSHGLNTIEIPALMWKKNAGLIETREVVSRLMNGKEVEMHRDRNCYCSYCETKI